MTENDEFDDDFGSITDPVDGVEKLTVKGAIVTETEMRELQTLICRRFKDILEKGYHYDPKSGMNVPLQPPMFTAIATFLNQNRIVGLPKAGAEIPDMIKKFMKNDELIKQAVEAASPSLLQ